jgi:large subunit ribosomal protein L1
MGKKYNEKLKLVDADKKYPLSEAVAVVKQLATAKFDETVNLAVRLGIDVKQSDQQVRGTVSLPHGLGRKVTVAVITSGTMLKDAESNGADHVGAEDLIEKISGGFTDFDVLVASPDMMAKVGKLGKVLGPKGLMPAPKAGTVTAEIGKAVKEFKAGKIEFKADKFGIIHLPIGKLSFEEKKLAENYAAIYDSLLRAKPTTSKGVYLKSIVISPTMGPGVKVQVSEN